MSKRVGGVLAARHGWCGPDEVIRFAVPCTPSGIRFDVDGLSWDGRSGSAGKGIERAFSAVEGLVNASSDYDDRLPPPKVVCFGPGPQSQVMGFRPVTEDADVRFTWMLTSHRLALLAEVPEPPEPEQEKEESSGSFWQKARKFGAGVRDFSRDVADILQDKKLGAYPANEPIPVAPVTSHGEVPVQQVRAIGRATRKLPRSYASRKVFALRVELADGSGLDVISAAEENIVRLEAMAFGRQ